MENTWSIDIEKLLENSRQNCVLLSKLHKQEYLYYKSYLKWFKLPIIAISAINSVISLGLQPYLEQSYISALNSGLSLICGIITSTEIYLGITNRCENELDMSKSFYLLSVDIFKMLSLDRQNRNNDGSQFLETTLNRYCQLIEKSNITAKKILDELQPLTNDMRNASNSLTSSQESVIINI